MEAEAFAEFGRMSADRGQITGPRHIGRAIEDILLLAEASLDNEWEGQVRYLPL